MKKFALIFICMVSITFVCSSQIVINSRFKPLSYEELYVEAMMKAEYDRQQKAKFEHYQQQAYDCYNKQDWYGFLTYSNYALETGWYDSKLYYDRGVVFERLNNFKEAKKSYKKAKKKGYAYAEAALQSCKEKEKEYKRLQKLYKK